MAEPLADLGAHSTFLAVQAAALEPLHMHDAVHAATLNCSATAPLHTAP